MCGCGDPLRGDQAAATAVSVVLLSAAAYGLGAGLFFVSYALLEVPSNLVLYRIGAGCGSLASP